MNIVVFVKGNRGVSCLRHLLETGRKIDLLILQSQPNAGWYVDAIELVEKYDLEISEPDNPNDPEFIDFLSSRDPDLMVLAGYGKILRADILDVPREMTINLHGGMLPEFRGSSPMNWALIRGEEEFGISVIKVDAGVDTGNLLCERRFSVGPNDTICDLHRQADEAFPEMLVEVINAVDDGSISPVPQDDAKGRYFPARFPEDGLILWDVYTAHEIHNRVRALTTPYPCAYTYYGGRKVRLVATRLRDNDFFGEPGRVYLVKNESILVCARDKCLWIDLAEFEDTGEALVKGVERYRRLATVSEAAEAWHMNQS